MNRKNMDKFINEAMEIEYEEARQAGSIGYMARALTQATMPHSKISSHEYKRKNGNFKLTMLADSETGLPYGSIPRLLMSWITTEAVRIREREITLGNTLSGFMSELGIIPTGGRWGSITRVKEQMKRLFSASISCTYDNGKNWKIQNVTPIDKANLWWDPKQPDQAAIWESTLVLGEFFFNEIIENPIPIDIRTLKALKKSPMAIDIYCWLTYRMSYLKRDTHIPWKLLQLQFGANYNDIYQFKRRFLDQLKKVIAIYAGASVIDEKNHLTLQPGKPQIVTI